MRKITARNVTQSLERNLFPVLKELGYTFVGNRQAFRRNQDAYCCLSYKCLGSNMGARSGLPSVSINILAGVLIPAIPNPYSPVVEYDKDGCPLAYTVTSDLYRELSKEPRAGLDLPPSNDGCWWVDSDGGNLDQVTSGIAEVVRTEGEAWFARWDTEERAFDTLMEAGRDNRWHSLMLHLLAKKLQRSVVMAENIEKLKRNWPLHWEGLV